MESEVDFIDFIVFQRKKKSIHFHFIITKLIEPLNFPFFSAILLVKPQCHLSKLKEKKKQTTRINGRSKWFMLLLLLKTSVKVNAYLQLMSFVIKISESRCN